MSDTSEAMEQRIRVLAHGLWEKEGHPDGRAEEFWHRARSQVESEDKAPAMVTAPPLTDAEANRGIEHMSPASDAPTHGVIVGPES